MVFSYGYTDEEYCEMVRCYHKCNYVYTKARDLYRKLHPTKSVPTVPTIKRAVQRLRKCGTIRPLAEDAANEASSSKGGKTASVLDSDSETDTDDADDDIDVKHDILLQGWPVVYTTKLDSMNTVQKDLRPHSPKKILDMLLNESKPRFFPETLKVTPMSKFDKNSYIKLSEVVEKIKLKARLRAHCTNSRNSKLLAQCKPFSIVLNNVICQEQPIKIEVNEDSLSSDSDDITLDHFKSHGSSTTQISPIKMALIVLVHENGAADVYRVKCSKFVTESYETTKDKLSKIWPMYPNDEKFITNYCCWVKRQEIVTKLCVQEKYSYTIQRFLRQHHGCQPGKCNCCCNPNNIKSTKKVSSIGCVTVKKNVSSNCTSSLLSKQPLFCSGLIGKAMNYIPDTIEKEKLTMSPDNYLTNFLLCIQNSKDNIYSFYEIGEKGDVVKSFRLDNINVVKATQETYEKKGFSVMIKTFCCWYTRERLIYNLQNLKVSPITLKFIRTPHVCKTNIDYCICCCKLRDTQLTPINWPVTLNHTTSYKKETKCFSIQFRSEEAYNTCSSITPHIDKNHYSTINKYKQFKLRVNSEGQLAVALDSPAKHLSVAELKECSHVLTAFTKQMIEMEISPEKFCHLVNNKSILHDEEETQRAVAVKTPLQNKKNRLAKRRNEKRNIVSIIKNKNIDEPVINTFVDTNTPATLQKPYSKTHLKMYDELSRIMSTKTINYVNAFKPHFKINYAPNFKSEHNLFQQVIENVNTVVIKNNDDLPKIADTFSLAKTLDSVTHNIACYTWKPNLISDTSDDQINVQHTPPETESSSNIQSCIPKAGLSGLTLVKQSDKTNLNITKSAATSGRKPSKRECTRSRILSSKPIICVNPKLMIKNESCLTLTKILNTKQKPFSYQVQQPNETIRVKSPTRLLASTTTPQIVATSATIISNLQSQTQPANASSSLSPILVQQQSENSNQFIFSQPVNTPINIVASNAMSGSNLPVVKVANDTVALNNFYQVNGLTTVQNENVNSGMKLISIPKKIDDNETMSAPILGKPQIGASVSEVSKNFPVFVPIGGTATNVRSETDDAQTDTNNIQLKEKQTYSPHTHDIFCQATSTMAKSIVKKNLPAGLEASIDVEKSIPWSVIVDTTKKE